MIRIRYFAALGVLAALLIVGATTVYAGWSWNTLIDVQGVEVRTAWTVLDDPDGDHNYEATIRLKLPREVEAEVVETAETEVLLLETGRKLECRSRGIEAEVRYEIEPLEGAIGKRVQVTVTADGEVLGQKTGHVGKKIKLKHLIIPATCPSDSDEDEGHHKRRGR